MAMSVHVLSNYLLFSLSPAETLPMPAGNLAAEIVIVLLMAGLEGLRLFFGKDNLKFQHSGIGIYS